MSGKLLAATALAVALTAVSTGCADNKSKAEKTSLLQQNKALQDQLDAEKAARAAAEARANTPPIASTDNTPPAGAPGMEAPVDTGAPAESGSGVTIGKNDRGETTMTVSSDVLFDSGKAALKPTAKTALDKVAGIVKKQYAGQQLRVEGYTDPNPVKRSGWDDNWDLGAARARAVLLYLEGKGVHNMYIASFGSTKLKSTKNLAADRRVEIVVVK